MEDFSRLTNSQLLSECRKLAAVERRASADTLACLAEIARRHAAEEAGFPSLFEFCVVDLKMSSGAAYKRVKAVEAARARPEIFSLLASGEISFSTLILVAPRLRSSPGLLDRAKGKTTREVERLVADQFPAAEAPRDRIRLMTIQAPAENGAPSSMPARLPGSGEPGTDVRAVSAEQAPAREVVRGAEIRFFASDAFLQMLRKLQAVLWHKHGDDNLEAVLGEAISEFLRRRDPSRARRPSRQRNGLHQSRRPPAAVEREVRLRDGERCAYLASDGRRCEQTKGLELDHIVPWARGGRSNDSANLRLLCRAHNQAQARRVFGDAAVGPRPKDAPS